jgi:phage shock protein E
MKTFFRCFSLIALMFATSIVFADSVWIDVRSPEEYAQDHIDGDLNIHFQNIGDEIAKHVPDKNTDIHLYCQAGGRAGLALVRLSAMGYKHVTNEGGIADVRVLRKNQNHATASIKKTISFKN